MTDQLEGVSTNFQTNQIQLEQDGLKKMKRIAELESECQQTKRKFNQLQAEFETVAQSKEVLQEDNLDLKKQLIEVETICKQQLVATQAQSQKTQQMMKDVIQKQSEERKQIMDVINQNKIKEEELTS